MKNVIISILIVILGLSCQSPQNNSKDDETTANQKTIEQYFKYFNTHDWTALAKMYVDSAEFKDPSFGKEIVKQSYTQIIEKYTQLHNMFPDIHDQVICIYPSNKNHMVVEFVSSGTGLDQQKFELPICTIFKIENGKIIADYTYYDN